MNTKNNKRRQQTREKIEGILMELLQTRELSQIRVSDICKLARVNRSTFYANYDDIYALGRAIGQRLEQEVDTLYDYDLASHTGFHYLALFQHICAHQSIYKAYFKLGYDQTHIITARQLSPMGHPVSFPHLDYRIEFHKAGLNAVIKKWLWEGCQETPEEMVEIIKAEYQGRNPNGFL